MSISNLSKAAFFEDIKAVIYFLGKGEDCNGEPFVQAILRGNISTVSLMVDHWVKIGKSDIKLSEMRHGVWSEQTRHLKSCKWLASLSGL